MILNDGLNVLAPNGFGVDPDPAEEVAAPTPEPKSGRRVKTPATAPTATTPEEEAPEAVTAAGPADSSEAAETTTDTATDTTTEETE